MKVPLRILHLEDDGNDAELIQEALLAEGIIGDIDRVETRADFLACLEEEGFDIILADFALPSFDGLAGLSMALEKRPELPFIFVSGAIGEELAIEILKQGATDYVLKHRLSRLGPAVLRALREVEERSARKQAVADLKRQYKQLQAIYQMTEVVSRAESLESIYQAALDAIQDALQADRAAILLADQANVMRFIAWYGLSDEYRRQAEGHSAWSPEEKKPQPVFASDITAEPGLAALRPALLAEGIRALAFIPLVSQERLRGRFMLYYDTAHAFTPEEGQLAQSIANEIALAIERKQGEEALRQSRDQLNVILHGITEGITVQEPGGRLIYANEAAAQIVGYPSAQDLMEAPVTQVTQKFELLDESDEPLPLSSLPGRVALQGQQPEELLVRFRILETGEQRWSAVNATPIFDEQGQVQFAVNIFHDLTERIRLYESEKTARQLAEETAERIAGLQVVTASLSEALTPTQVAEIIVEQGMAVLNADAGSVALLNDEAQALEIIYAAGYPRQQVEQWRDIPLGSAIPLTDVTRSGEIIFLGSSQALIDSYPHLAGEIADKGRHAWVAIPLQVEGRTIGAMNLSFVQPGALGEDDRDFMLSLARQCAQALERARLYWETNRLNEELEQRVLQRTEQLEEANAQLEEANIQLEEEVQERQQAEDRLRLQAARTAALVRTAARLNNQLDLETVLQAVCEETAQALKVAISTVSLYDEKQDALVPVCAYGLSPELSQQLQPVPRTVYEAYTQRMGPLVVIPDVQTLADLPNASLYARLNIRTTVSTTMLREGQLVGRLNIGTVGEARHFNENELALLKGLTEQAALAISNAREVTERKQAEEALRRSEALYRTLAHNIPNGSVSLVDRDLRYLLVEGPTLARHGFLNFEGKTIWEVLPPELAPERAAQYQAALAGTPNVIEVEIDGYIYLSHCVPLRNEAGEIYAAMVLSHDITERKRAEAEVERRARQLIALGRMGQAVTASLDLPMVFRRVLAEISPLLPTEGVSILLQERDELHFVAVSGPGAATMEGRRLPITAGIAGQVMQSGRPIWLQDAAGHEHLFRDLEKANGYRVESLLAVPLTLQGRIIGVIEAVHHLSSAFTADDLQLLEAAASWVTIAINNARQHEDLQRRLQESETLAAISRALLGERPEQERLLQRIVQAARQIIAVADWAVIHLFDEAKELLRPAAMSGLDIVDPSAYTLGLGEGFAGRVAAEGVSINVGDVPSDPHHLSFHEQARIGSILIVPLKSEERQAGTISVASARPGAFSADDERLLGVLGVQAALAIQNTRLYEALAEETRRLELLYNLSQNLATTLDPRQVATRALDLTTEALGAFRAELFLLDTKSQNLYLTAASGYEETSLILLGERSRLPVGQGIAGYVAQVRTPIAIPDLSCDEHWLPLPGLDDEICSAAAVPLLVGEEMVGVLALLSDKEDYFSEQHLLLLQAVATPVALSLQNARLYEAEQQARHVADTLRAANLAMSERLDLDAILETLLDRLGELVPYDSASVMLLDSHAQLAVRAIRGFERWSALDEVRATSFDLQATPNLHALTSAQKGFIIADTAEYPGWERRAGSEHVRNWLGAPLLAEGRVIGVFALDKREPGFFTEIHLRLVEALATQAAIAIQNAHLYQQVRTGRERLRQLTQQVVSAQEEERRRVSRELHDEAGQALTALKISLSMMQSRLSASPPSIRQDMAAAVDLTDQTMEHIRLLAQNLRPPALETLGLNSTLDGLCRDFAGRTKLPVVYEGVELPRLPDAITISLYRFAQEALTNVVKHANAGEAQVTLGHDGHMIIVSVSDDGQGFNVEERLSAPAHLEGIGLMGMLERLALLGGRLDIDSDIGRGTRLVAYVPLPEE